MMVAELPGDGGGVQDVRFFPGEVRRTGHARQFSNLTRWGVKINLRREFSGRCDIRTNRPITWPVLALVSEMRVPGRILSMFRKADGMQVGGAPVFFTMRRGMGKLRWAECKIGGKGFP